MALTLPVASSAVLTITPLAAVGDTTPVTVITPLAPAARSAIFQIYAGLTPVLVMATLLATLRLVRALGMVSVRFSPLARLVPVLVKASV